MPEIDECSGARLDAVMPNPIRIYAYQKCSTCRQALRFLRTNEIPYTAHDIIQTPPTSTDLCHALSAVGGEVRKLFNTSGQQYRELGISEKLNFMSEKEAIRLLTSNGRLIKRPFAIWEQKGQTHILIGFKDSDWKRALDV